MKANPISTAPKDGRTIIINSSEVSYTRARWNTQLTRWENPHGFPIYNAHEWIEDIEPPERSIIIEGVEFRLSPDGHLLINNILFIPSDVAALREFLNNDE